MQYDAMQPFFLLNLVNDYSAFAICGCMFYDSDLDIQS